MLRSSSCGFRTFRETDHSQYDLPAKLVRDAAAGTLLLLAEGEMNPSEVIRWVILQ